MTDVKVGDEVRVFEGRHYSRSLQPEDGWPGHVTKAGRKYATAEYEYAWIILGGKRHETRAIEFDMQTGYERGTVGNYADRVKTRLMAERDRRRADALAVLKAHRIEFGFGHSLTLEQVEALADVAKTFKQEG